MSAGIGFTNDKFHNFILNSDQSINVSHITKGIYMIRLKTKQKETARKLIIK
ncbi:T9SS type A sorting domain-containing protein [Chryseobacterium ginsenosidimutans]|uniref:T9SS type A sorting domain-containing protein n=1 Tax=Chryseobacterium ginsenosidimutans TaxID=687846 RepID=UPI0035B5815B